VLDGSTHKLPSHHIAAHMLLPPLCDTPAKEAKTGLVDRCKLMSRYLIQDFDHQNSTSESTCFNQKILFGVYADVGLKNSSWAKFFFKAMIYSHFQNAVNYSSTK
jgi:hypothetical protein